MSSLELFGRLVFWYLAIRLSIWLVKPIVRRLRRGTVWRTDNRTAYAVVTGGTDGIGLAYSRYLANLGYKLLIISRNADKLKAVKDQLEGTIPNCPEVDVLSFDFSVSEMDYQLVERKLDSLPGRIDVLVNNVGVSFKTCEFFSVIAARQSELLRQMISVNAVSAVKMSQLVLPAMIQQNRGVIINVGSQSAVSPVPLLALYSATKAFVDYFSRATADELATKAPGVIVHSVLPGFVATKMSHLRPSWRVPGPEVYLRSAMDKVGVEGQTFGFWYHSLVGFFYALTEWAFGEHFNCWLAFTILSNYRRKFYRSKKIRFNTFFD